MKKHLLLALALSVSVPLVSAAQDASVVMDAGMAMAADAGMAATEVAGGVPSSGGFSAKAFLAAVEARNGWLIAALILFGFVGGMRIAGRKIHEFIPDTSMWDKPFWFLFDTKVGGWLMNWLTAIAGALGTAQAAGVPVDAHAWQIAVLASTSATTLIELWDDVSEWLAKRKAAKEAAAAVPKEVKK